MKAEDKKSQQERVAQAERAAKAEQVKLEGAVDEILRTESGRRVFAHLFQICEYNGNNLAVSSQKGVDTQASLYNMARRSVYIQMRKLGAPELVHAVENEIENRKEERIPQ